MSSFRKFALCLLTFPLMLNGLWVICRDVPPQKTQEAVQSQSPEDELKVECEKLCARQSSLCLISPGDKTSLSIVVLGVAIFPSDVQVSSPALSREPVAQARNLYLGPNIAQPSPPPEA